MRAPRIEFIKTPAVTGWEVIRVVRGPSLLGTIVKRSPQLPYRYFVGADNSIAFELEHRDLETLKKLIESSSISDSQPEPAL